MVHKRVSLGGVLITAALAMAGCPARDGAGGSVTLDGARKAAVDAGPSPATCPIPFDVPAALPGDQAVEPGTVEVETSTTTTPAADPLAAQRNQGMSALDAVAGVSIACGYDVDGRTVDTWLVATAGPGAVNLMAPRIASAAGLDMTQLREFLARPPEPGEVTVTPGGDVAVARIRVEGDGDASLLVDPDGVVTGDALREMAKTLATQIDL